MRLAQLRTKILVELSSQPSTEMMEYARERGKALPAYCRKVPYNLVRGSELLVDVKAEDFPADAMGSAFALALCDRTVSEGSLVDLLDSTGATVVLGQTVPQRPDDMGEAATRLRALCLSETQLEDKGATAIGHSLRNNTKLVNLVLNINTIGNAGMERFAEGLKSNTTLATLRLQLNQVSDAGAVQLAKAIGPCPCLKTLKKAIEENQAEIVAAIFRHGCRYLPARMRASPQEYVLRHAARWGATDVVKVVLDAGSPVDELDEGGRTPLLIATEGGHLSTIRALLEKGADIRHRDHSNATSFMIAAREGHEKVLESILGTSHHITYRLRIEALTVRELRWAADGETLVASGKSKSSVLVKQLTGAVYNLTRSVSRNASYLKSTVGSNSTRSFPSSKGSARSGSFHARGGEKGSSHWSILFGSRALGIFGRRNAHSSVEHETESNLDARDLTRNPSSARRLPTRSASTEREQGATEHSGKGGFEVHPEALLPGETPGNLLRRLASRSQADALHESRQAPSSHEPLKPVRGKSFFGSVFGKPRESHPVSGEGVERQRSFRDMVKGIGFSASGKFAGVAQQAIVKAQEDVHDGVKKRSRFDKPPVVKLWLKFQMGDVEGKTTARETKASEHSLEMNETLWFMDETPTSKLNIKVTMLFNIDDSYEEETLGVAHETWENLVEDGINNPSQEKWITFISEESDGPGEVVGQARLRVRMVPEILFDTDKTGDNGLLMASRKGHLPVINFLLGLGADVNCRDLDKNTPLIAAAMNGCREAAEMLLAHGADLLAENRFNQTAATAADRHGFHEVGFVLHTHMMVKHVQPVSLKEWTVEGEFEDGDKKKDPLAFLKTRYKGAFSKSMLQLEVVQARNLPKADDGPLGLSDPFCVLKLNGMERKTRVITRSLNPVFEERFSFDDQLLGVWPSQSIDIKIFDFDMTSAPDLLGSVTLTLRDLIDKDSGDRDSEDLNQDGIFEDRDLVQGERWIRLRDMNGEVVRGQHNWRLRNKGLFEDSELMLRYSFQPARGRHLVLRIIEAKNITAPIMYTGKRPRGWRPGPNPQVVVSMADSEVRTSSFKVERNPKFGSEYRFAVRTLDGNLTLKIVDTEIDEPEKMKRRVSGEKIEKKKTYGSVMIPLTKVASLHKADLKDMWLFLYEADGNRARDLDSNPVLLHVQFELHESMSPEALSKLEGTNGKIKDSEEYERLNPSHQEPFKKVRDVRKLTPEVQTALKQFYDSFKADMKVKQVFDALKADCIGEIFPRDMHDRIDDELHIEMTMEELARRFQDKGLAKTGISTFAQFLEVLNWGSLDVLPDPVDRERSDAFLPPISPMSLRSDGKEEDDEQDRAILSTVNNIGADQNLRARRRLQLPPRQDTHLDTTRGLEGVRSAAQVLNEAKDVEGTTFFEDIGFKDRLKTKRLLAKNQEIDKVLNIDEHDKKVSASIKGVVAAQGRSARYQAQKGADGGIIESLVNREVVPVVGMQVCLCKEAIEKHPELIEDSNGGPGVITNLNKYRDIGAEAGEICSVEWKDTGKLGDYRTGWEGIHRLAVYAAPAHLGGREKVINQDIDAVVGLRVVLRNLTRSLHPELISDTGGGPGTITWVDGNDLDGDGETGDMCQVRWDLTGKLADYRTGYMDDYRLALYEVDTEIKSSELEILQHLHVMSFLQTLVLDDNMVADKGATAIADALRQNHALEFLSLNRNRIGSAGGEAIGRALLENNHLKFLSLNSNMLGDIAMKRIAVSLFENGGIQLQTFEAESNGIGPDGVRGLSHALFKNKSLVRLCLSQNLIGADGAGLLAQGVRASRSLQHLGLSKNVLGDIGVRYVAKALRRVRTPPGQKDLEPNTTVKVITLDGNNLTDLSIEEFLVSLLRNRVVHTVSIEENDEITIEAQSRLKEHLAENVNLHELDRAASYIQKLFRGRRQRKKDAAERRIREEQERQMALMEAGKALGDAQAEGEEVASVVNTESTSLPIPRLLSAGEDMDGRDSRRESADEGEVEETLKAVSGMHDDDFKKLITFATKTSILQTGEALLREQSAAEAIARLSAHTVKRAYESYALLEAHVREMLADQDAHPEDIQSALEALHRAQEHAIQAMAEAEEAEEAAIKIGLSKERLAELERQQSVAEEVQEAEDPNATPAIISDDNSREDSNIVTHRAQAQGTLSRLRSLFDKTTNEADPAARAQLDSALAELETTQHNALHAVREAEAALRAQVAQLEQSLAADRATGELPPTDMQEALEQAYHALQSLSVRHTSEEDSLDASKHSIPPLTRTPAHPAQDADADWHRRSFLQRTTASEEFSQTSEERGDPGIGVALGEGTLREANDPLRSRVDPLDELKAIEEKDAREQAELRATRNLIREEILRRVAEADAALLAGELRLRAGEDVAERLVQGDLEVGGDVDFQTREKVEEESRFQQRPEVVHAIHVRSELGGTAAAWQGGIPELRSRNAIMSDGEESEITSGAVTPSLQPQEYEERIERPASWEDSEEDVEEGRGETAKNSHFLTIRSSDALRRLSEDHARRMTSDLEDESAFGYSKSIAQRPATSESQVST